MTDSLVRPLSRLDRDTTGIILFARYPHIQQQLQLRDRYAKQYLLITDGVPAEDHGFIDLPIFKDDERSFRMSWGPGGKNALTEYTVLDRTSEHALVAARLHTGRTHQLRVHFTASGCPIHGDTLYGAPSPETPGQALHCFRIRFRHPVTHDDTLLEAPPPAAFLSALEYCHLRSDVHTGLPEILC